MKKQISWLKSWFKIALRWKGSVAPKVFPGVVLFAFFAFVISWLHSLGLPVAWESLDSVITNVSYNFVLGLQLVFRTNTAYDRFWEGRKAWATITTDLRSLGYLLWVSVGEENSSDRIQKISQIKLLMAWAIAAKLYLKKQPLNIESDDLKQNELDRFVSPAQQQLLKSSQVQPLQILIWNGEYIQTQYNRKLINANQLTAMNVLSTNLLQALTTCDRIIDTPIPIAYSIYLKRLLLIYFFSLPFQFVNSLGWWTSPVVAILSFVLLGLEEIAFEIENPFQDNPNDLPIANFCEVIIQNLENLIEVNHGTGEQMATLMDTLESNKKEVYV